MGDQSAIAHEDRAARARHARQLLDDLTALEEMLARGLFDDGPARVGAEQELHLVDEHLSPLPIAPQLLARLADRRYTAELALFNLEANLTPRRLGGRFLAEMEAELVDLCGKARAAVRAVGGELLMTGFLPTYEPAHAGLHQMTANPRFAIADRAAVGPRGGRVDIFIRGRDAVELAHDNIMLEGGSTSFQVHLQVAPSQFAAAFNASLLVAAPLVAACANSALLFGHRLWHESRVPLLEASGDMRSPAQLRRPGQPRTRLGDGWVDRSITELYRADLLRFEPILGAPEGPLSTEELAAGRIPALKALATFNGTVWRWVRPCYGITDGKPHLRIENRVLPAGPTIPDQVANAALWLGLVLALTPTLEDVARRMPFSDALDNYYAAARAGLDAPLRWLDGEKLTAGQLLARLVPAAREALGQAGAARSDVNRCFDLVCERLARGRTGAVWMLGAYDALPPSLTARERAWEVTRTMLGRCWSTQPGHAWPIAPDPARAQPTPLAHGARPKRVLPSVAALLRTDFVTVPPHAPALLAEQQLAWSNLPAIAVEAESGELAGLLGAEDFARWREEGGDEEATVEDLVDAAAPVAVSPEAPVDAALASLERAGGDCAVVLRDRHLAGLVLRADLLRAVVGSTTSASDAVGAADAASAGARC